MNDNNTEQIKEEMRLMKEHISSLEKLIENEEKQDILNRLEDIRTIIKYECNQIQRNDEPLARILFDVRFVLGSAIREIENLRQRVGV